MCVGTLVVIICYIHILLKVIHHKLGSHYCMCIPQWFQTQGKFASCWKTSLFSLQCFPKVTQPGEYCSTLSSSTLTLNNLPRAAVCILMSRCPTFIWKFLCHRPGAVVPRPFSFGDQFYQVNPGQVYTTLWLLHFLVLPAIVTYVRTCIHRCIQADSHTDCQPVIQPIGLYSFPPICVISIQIIQHCVCK